MGEEHQVLLAYDSISIAVRTIAKQLQCCFVKSRTARSDYDYGERTRMCSGTGPSNPLCSPQQGHRQGGPGLVSRLAVVASLVF